ncbi:MAG: hypothetical protein RML93_05970 [Anaerolineales bacterium]|nr:hypothetical protein [Anaerolineales bacterium]MCS7247012.1 hypothetical protein [Anaerolineales bacterium]MDW8160823.1 hypothetical protein [Anaerolineales bacterium]MDW8446821.1 hypothetical protein [Anaerolineales bacterium]
MEEEPLGYRVGVYLILVGLMALIPFLASEQLNRPDYRYFFTALFLMIIGAALMWRNRPPKRQDVQRFRILKRKSKEKKEG